MELLIAIILSIFDIFQNFEMEYKQNLWSFIFLV